jgi:apolipoprotein N-acyltransferase
MWQMLAGSVITAVTVRRPIARATNTGETGIVDITGVFSGNIGDYQRGVYIGDVPIIDEKVVSLYVKFGFLFPYLLSFVAFAFLIYSVFKNPRKQKKPVK